MNNEFLGKKYVFKFTTQSLVIGGVEQLESTKIDGPVLIVQHVNKQPPHIAIGYLGHYFSLTVKGPEVEIDLELRIQKLRKLKVPTMFFFLSEPIIKIGLEEVSMIFKRYKPLKTGGTCLAPITDFYKKAYKLNPSRELVFGLLEELDAQNRIESIYSIQLQEFLQNENTFSMNYYTPETVQMRIENLIKKKNPLSD
jgi:hypothetical protein